MGFSPFDWLSGGKAEQAHGYDPNPQAFHLDNQYGDALKQALASAGQNPQQEAARAQQGGLAQALQARVSGQAPSAAGLQLQQGLDAQISAQRAQAASARGVSPGMAQRLAARNIAQSQQATNQQAASLRAGEQAQAEQTLGQVLSGMRGQDLQSRAQLDSATQSYIAMGMSHEQATQQALADLERLRGEQALGVQQADAAERQRMGQGRQAVIGGLANLGGMAAAGALSDERAKTEIDRNEAPEKVGEFLDALDTASWKYKPGVGEDTTRKRFGVMAQSVAKSELGRSFVNTRGDGLLELDTPKGLGALLVAAKDLHGRVRKLEATAS